MFILLLIIFTALAALQNKTVYTFVCEGQFFAMAENNKSVEIVYRVAPKARRKLGFKGWLCFMVRRCGRYTKFFTGLSGVFTCAGDCMQVFTKPAEIRV